MPFVRATWIFFIGIMVVFHPLGWRATIAVWGPLLEPFKRGDPTTFHVIKVTIPRVYTTIVPYGFVESRNFPTKRKPQGESCLPVDLALFASWPRLLFYIVIVLLLMEEILTHLGCIKPCKSWEIYCTISTAAGFQPSTVLPSLCRNFNKPILISGFWWTNQLLNLQFSSLVKPTKGQYSV